MTTPDPQTPKLLFDLFGANGGSRPSIDPRIARLPFLDIHGWPGCHAYILGLIKFYGGKLHKGVDEKSMPPKPISSTTTKKEFNRIPRTLR